MTTTCPSCHSDLTGSPIPEHHRDHYTSGSTHFTHFTRLMAEYCIHRDMTIGYTCPDCQFTNVSREVFEKETK